MDQETGGRKICFALQGVFWLVCFGAMGGLYISSLKRANDIDRYLCPDETTPQCLRIDGEAYDNSYFDGPFKDSDEHEAEKL